MFRKIPTKFDLLLTNNQSIVFSIFLGFKLIRKRKKIVDKWQKRASNVQQTRNKVKVAKLMVKNVRMCRLPANQPMTSPTNVEHCFVQRGGRCYRLSGLNVRLFSFYTKRFIPINISYQSFYITGAEQKIRSHFIG